MRCFLSPPSQEQFDLLPLQMQQSLLFYLLLYQCAYRYAHEYLSLFWKSRLVIEEKVKHSKA